MPIPKPILGVAIEDGGATLLARIVGNDAANINQASISAITYNVFTKGGGVDRAENSPLSKTVVIFDTLQTDAVWTIDGTGYNFKYAAVPLEFPTGNEVSVFEFKFTPTTGQVFYVLYEIDILGLIGS